MSTPRSRARSIATALLAVVSLTTIAPVASAQVIKKEVKVDAPTPGREDSDRHFLSYWLVMIAIIAAIIGVNCIPAKRGHQD